MATNSQFGAFIPTTDVYDIFSNPEMDMSGEDMKLFLVRLRQSINNVALVLNIKDSGYYLPAEFINGQLFFPNPDPAVTGPTRKNAVYRQDYRMTVDFGALPNTATKSVPHNIPDISSNFTYTRFYATATNPTGLTGISIPAPTALGNIYMNIDATNINITTTFDATAYTRCLVIVEYLKD